MGGVSEALAMPPSGAWTLEDLSRSLYIPDALVIVATVDAEQQVIAATDVRLVVEVLSPSNRTTDLVTKRVDYAAAGIPSYWLVDPEVPSVTVLELEGNSYAEAAVVRGDEPYAATEPFAVTVVPSALRRPPRRA